jgi:hypothetical protein
VLPVLGLKFLVNSKQKWFRRSKRRFKKFSGQSMSLFMKAMIPGTHGTMHEGCINWPYLVKSGKGLPRRLKPVVDDDGLHQLVVAHHQVVRLAQGEAPALR